LSTILKALKKLEQELPVQTDVLPGTRKSSAKQTISRRVRRFSRLHKPFWISLGIISLAAAGWIIFTPLSPSSRKSVPPSVPGKPDKITKKSSAAPQLEKQKPGALPRINLRPDMPVTASRLPQKSSKQRGSPIAATSNKKIKPLKTATPGLPSKIADAMPVSVEPLEDSKLRLQAISWSEKPENRIAVINSNILREGDSVEGFRIIQIYQDEVLVRAGAKEWKLVFGLK
jgi:hypothetical protein